MKRSIGGILGILLGMLIGNEVGGVVPTMVITALGGLAGYHVGGRLLLQRSEE